MAASSKPGDPVGSHPGPAPPPGAARPAPGPVNHCSRRRSVERSERKSRPGAGPPVWEGPEWAWSPVGRAGPASWSLLRPKGQLKGFALSHLPSSLRKQPHRSHRAVQPQLSTRHPTNTVVTDTPCTGTHRLPLMSPKLTPSQVTHPRRRGCAHRDPSRPLHVDTGSAHCGSKLSAGCFSHQPHST